MRSRFFAILSAVFLFSPVGHSAETGQDVEADSTDGTFSETIALSSESEVFARKGDAVVTQADFDQFLRSVPERDRAGVINSPDRLGDLLDRLMLRRLLATAAMDDGLLEDEAVQADLFERAIRRLGDLQLERVWHAAELENYESQARELYIRYEDRFMTEPTVSFVHLMVDTEQQSSEEALEKVRSLKARVDAGESLEELAAEYSDDPSVAENGGRFEDIHPERLDPEFAEALLALEEGDVSDPVATQFGWHLIRLEARNPERKQPFDEIRDELEQEARDRHKIRVKERYQSRLISQPMQIEDDAVRILLRRYGVNHDQGYENIQDRQIQDSQIRDGQSQGSGPEPD